uniref:beta-N-acetylhexosaminidase n=1 Tax=Quercus lobata TaxID=97700 RepID=A0A7N2R263_QUELO
MPKPKLEVGERESTLGARWFNGSSTDFECLTVNGSRTEFRWLSVNGSSTFGTASLRAEWNDSQYDQQTSDNSGNGGSWCGPFKTWQTIYNYDITYGLIKEEANLVLGGEVALWSEQADPAVLDARIWPRTSAMAETLWSGNRDETGKKSYAEATDRLNEWRYRMVRRGIGAEPIQPLWCIRNPGMCNTVQSFA